MLRLSVRVVETLMSLEGKAEMLQWRPSEVAAALCSEAQVPVPACFPAVPSVLTRIVHDAWAQSFDE